MQQQTNRIICTRCVMDTTDPRIVFDNAGVCDHCLGFDQDIRPNWHIDELALERLSNEIRKSGKGRDFDCLIGMSGGIDSSYLTYIAREKMNLRPLVFHVDAGWNSQEAVHNIEQLVDGLSLELFTEVINWEEMRDLQIAFFKSGVPHIDAPQDHAFFATMYKFAEEHKIRHILTGANYSTECIRNPMEWMYYQSDAVQLRDIHRRFGTRSLMTFPTTSILRHKVYLPYIKGIRVVKPLNLVEYNKEGAVRVLSEKFGYQAYPQKHFESRFTKFYEGFWLPERFGYDTRKVQYSSLILTGQMTRGEALAQLQKPSYNQDNLARDFDYVATKLGISSDELWSFFRAPKHTYRDYRSQQWLYRTGAALMRSLGLERGGKR